MTRKSSLSLNATKKLTLVREQAALHIATQKADAPVQMVRVILAKSKADPSPRDRYLNTPLHYAVERKDITLVRVLLEAKADVNAENEDYFTPIDLALRHKSTKKIAKLLRTHRLTLKQGPAGGFKRISGPLPRAPESKDGQIACKAFQVTTTEIYSYDGKSQMSLQQKAETSRNDSILGGRH